MEPRVYERAGEGEVNDAGFTLPKSQEEPVEEEIKLDPTTIFIGGMEMFGPNAWGEDRVRTVFGQYGAIQSVKFIRPSGCLYLFARCGVLIYPRSEEIGFRIRDLSRHHILFEGRRSRGSCSPHI